MEQEENGSLLKNKQESRKKAFKMTLLVFFLLVCIQFIYSGYSVISVVYIKNLSMNIWLLVITRCVIAAPISVLMAWLFEHRKDASSFFHFDLTASNPNRTRDILLIVYYVVMGSVSVAFNPIMYLQVVKFTSATYTAILSQLIPVFNSLLSLCMRLERLDCSKTNDNTSSYGTIVRFVGIIICVSFAVAVSAQGFVSGNDIDWRNWLYGTLLGVFNNLIYSLYMVMQMKLFYRNENFVQLRNKPFTVNCYCTVFGSAAYLIPGSIYVLCLYYYGSEADVASLQIPPIGALPILYAGVLNSCICFGVLTYCIRHSSAMISSCLYCLQVVTSIIMLHFLADESLVLNQYLCSIGVVVGALIVILSPMIN